MGFDIMSRAVRFDGVTILRNALLYRNPDLAGDFSCGVVSYWYKTSVASDSVILSAQSISIDASNNLQPRDLLSQAIG